MASPCRWPGPAIWISFVIAGVAALLSAVSYAEMAGLVPVAGSSYSYSYATMGEGMAWICGWCLVLEYAVSVAAVAVGRRPVRQRNPRRLRPCLPDAMSQPPGDGGVVNLPAIVIVVLAMILLVRGARESAWINTAIVIVKVGILIFFCAVAFTAFNAGNFEPLLPMGAAGVSAAASSVFFSYIGFDAASTAGEEASNPKRDLPRAIMLSMVIVTTIYVLVAVAAIGARPWDWFDGTEAALVQILDEINRAAVDCAGLRHRRRAGHRQHRADRPLRPDPHPAVDVPRRHGAQSLRPRLAAAPAPRWPEP